MKRSDLLRDMDTPMVMGVELDRRTLTPVKRFSRSTPVSAPVPALPCTIDFPPAKDPTFLRTLMAVSSGTIASLTGLSDYTEIDGLIESWIGFYLLHQDQPFEDWTEVWYAFVASRAVSA